MGMRGERYFLHSQELFPIPFQEIAIIVLSARRFQQPRVRFFRFNCSLRPIENERRQKQGFIFQNVWETFVVKELQGVESALFMAEGLKFIEYMTDKLTREEACSFAKIVGFFTVQITQGGKNFSQDIIIMENLLAGIDTQVNLVFDLKGSDNKKRYVEHSEPGQVFFP